MKNRTSAFHTHHMIARPVETDPGTLASNERHRNKRNGSGRGVRAGPLENDTSSGRSQLLATSGQRNEKSNGSGEIVVDEDIEVAINGQPAAVQSVIMSSLGLNVTRDVLMDDFGCVLFVQFNYTTICNLGSKEFNKSALQLIQQLVQQEPAEPRMLNQGLFGNRNEVRDMLQTERK